LTVVGVHFWVKEGREHSAALQLLERSNYFGYWRAIGSDVGLLKADEFLFEAFDTMLLP